jgi:hypothetical protein
MKKKDELLKECLEIMKRPSIEKWYNQNLKGKPQCNTINSLIVGIITDKISTKEALALALVIGIQWNEKFEGVP